MLQLNQKETKNVKEFLGHLLELNSFIKRELLNLIYLKFVIIILQKSYLLMKFKEIYKKIFEIFYFYSKLTILKENEIIYRTS